MIVLDTDIVSAFAKAKALDSIVKLFKSKTYITPRVHKELKVPIEHDYQYPKKIFEKLETLDLTKKEQKMYQELLNKNVKLGKGELESITVCIKRKCMFSSMDKIAIKFAKEKKVKVVVLKAIAKSMWKNKIYSKKEVKNLVKRIEEKDNRKINTRGIFEK